MVYSVDRMKRLYGTSDPAEAESLCSVLRQAGIESTFDREGLGIHVSDEDAPKAAEILAAHFEKQDPRETPSPPINERSKPMPRGLGLAVVLLPAGIIAVMFGFQGDWERALLIAGAVGGLVALVWVVHEWTDKKDGSAPR